MKQHPIFETITHWGNKLPNKLVVAPMSRISATPAGLPTTEMKDYYTRFAQGGFSIVFTEGLYTDNERSQGYFNQPGLVTEAQMEAWQPVTAAVKQNGALIIAQLMHAGALSQMHQHTLSPSAVQPAGTKLAQYGGSGSYPLPAEMPLADVKTARDGFINAATQAYHAGFNGIEIHAANGYLLDQFLTPELNQRTDKYGGNIENRFTIIKEIIAAIRQLLSSDFIIGIRLSEGKVNDLTYRWKDGPVTAKAILEQVKSLDIDYVHIAVQSGEWERDSFYVDGSSLSLLAKTITGKTVIANGGMHNLDRAAIALNNGHADLVAIGKAALADPYWPLKISEEKPVIPFHRDMLWPEATIAHTNSILNRLTEENALPL